MTDIHSNYSYIGRVVHKKEENKGSYRKNFDE